MIDVSKLDKSKTYVGLEVGTGIVAKIIQNLSHKVHTDMPVDQIASHAFMLRCKNNEWHVVEAHKKWPEGIKEYTVEEYNKENSNPVLIKEYELNNYAIDYWVANPCGYSVTNLLEVVEERLIGLKLKNDPAFICSEFVGYCSQTYDINKWLNKPLQEVCPIDWQVYLAGKEIK